MSESDYEVGKNRPPLATRFKPGVSGNPGGRPKGARNVASASAKVFNEKITITEQGRRQRVTKLEAALKQLANKAASGDPKALRLGVELMGFASLANAGDDAHALSPDQVGVQDDALLKILAEQMSALGSEEDDG